MAIDIQLAEYSDAAEVASTEMLAYQEEMVSRTCVGWPTHGSGPEVNWLADHAYVTFLMQRDLLDPRDLV